MVLAFGLAACEASPGIGPGGTAADEPAATVTELTIRAAASLREPLESAAAVYAAGRPGAVVRLAFDSSAAIRAQIEQGAPTDVFLSADESNPATLAAAGLTSGEPRAFAANGLAVIVPVGDGPIATPADLARDGVRIIAAGEDVPISGYAADLVEQLAALPGFPPDFEAAYAGNIVSREDNVAAVVAKIELGEGDAGIVYRTDAFAAAAATTLELPEGIEVVAIYSGVVVRDAPAGAEAGRFLDWLIGQDGQAILADAGFAPAP